MYGKRRIHCNRVFAKANSPIDSVDSWGEEPRERRGGREGGGEGKRERERDRERERERERERQRERERERQIDDVPYPILASPVPSGLRASPWHDVGYEHIRNVLLSPSRCILLSSFSLPPSVFTRILFMFYLPSSIYTSIAFFCS